MSITEETRLESYINTPTSERKKMILSILGDKQMTARMIAYALGFRDLNAVKPRLTELKKEGGAVRDDEDDGAPAVGGNILVNQIDGMRVEFNGDNNTILVMHRDKPGVIAAVTQLMHWEYAELNISNFHLARQRKGGDAVMTIEIDGQPPEELIGAIRHIENVTNAILIRRV